MHDGIPRVACHKQDLEFGIEPGEILAKDTPVPAWHDHVGEQEVDRSPMAVKHVDGLVCIASFNDLIIKIHQRLYYVPANLLIVLHNKDRFTSTRIGAGCVGRNRFARSTPTRFEASRF